MEKTVNFDVVSGIKAMLSEYAQLDDAYLVAHFGRDFIAGREPHPGVLVVDGLVMLILRQGSVDIEINLDHYEASGPSVCVVQPSSRLRIISKDADSGDCHLLFISQKFLQSININMMAFNLPSMVEKPSPVCPMTADELDMMERYMCLLAGNTRNQVSRQLSLSVGSSLIGALIYELTKIHYRRINAADGLDRPRNSRVAYVHDFAKLVRAHYAMERSVAFYASKLCISPKYLSLIVKEVTGRSAARWIDDFVLMEAKNMLRFSGKNIQQVAFALNFSNQSAFGKYFKHLTGMSPTEYQKS